MATALPALHRGIPVVRQTCFDGDPACDFDPTPGMCRFHLWACLGGADQRLQCAADTVTGVALLRPSASQTGLPALVRQALLAALDAVGFPVGPGEECTQRVDVDVPAGRRVFLLRTRTDTASGKMDGDILKLQCKRPRS
jgi:hypothetical protein